MRKKSEFDLLKFNVCWAINFLWLIESEWELFYSWNKVSCLKSELNFPFNISNSNKLLSTSCKLSVKLLIFFKFNEKVFTLIKKKKLLETFWTCWQMAFYFSNTLLTPQSHNSTSFTSLKKFSNFLIGLKYFIYFNISNFLFLQKSQKTNSKEEKFRLDPFDEISFLHETLL